MMFARRAKEGGTEKLRHWPRVTQPRRGRPGSGTQVTRPRARAFRAKRDRTGWALCVSLPTAWAAAAGVQQERQGPTAAPGGPAHPPAICQALLSQGALPASPEDRAALGNTGLPPPPTSPAAPSRAPTPSPAHQLHLGPQAFQDPMCSFSLFLQGDGEEGELNTHARTLSHTHTQRTGYK